MSTIQVYSFSYKNEDRKGRMTRRFEVLGHPITWVDPVLVTDPRVIVPDDSSKRPHAIMFNHIDMIHKFITESTADFGIFCEDDIYVRKDFTRTVQIAIDGYKRQKLDVILLGYLPNYKAFTWKVDARHATTEPPFSFITVGDDLWGSQMYMMDRMAAKRVYDSVCEPERVMTHFSPDWAITKFGNVAAIYPMLAIEEGAVVTDHLGQINFHKECFIENYNPALHF